jgi:hypothetical protein
MSDRPTPETAPLMHAAANESIEAVFLRGCDLERQRDEGRKELNQIESLFFAMRKERDAYAETLRIIAGSNDRSHHEAAFTALIRDRHPELTP